MTVTADVQSLPPPADPDAFVAMLQQHDRSLRALVFRLGGRDVMDDVLQETYLRAYRARDGFRGEASVGTWLYRIAYNACVDELRRLGRLPSAPLDEAADVPSAAADPADVAAMRGDLAAALASLSVEARAAVLLVDAEGLDYATAGRILGIAPGSVGARVSRARAVLRTALGGTR